MVSDCLVCREVAGELELPGDLGEGLHVAGVPVEVNGEDGPDPQAFREPLLDRAARTEHTRFAGQGGW